MIYSLCAVVENSDTCRQVHKASLVRVKRTRLLSLKFDTFHELTAILFYQVLFKNRDVLQLHLNSKHLQEPKI